MSSPANVEDLRRFITSEIFKALGISGGWAQRLLGPLFHPPTQRFAQLAAAFDERVAQHGFCEAARWVLPHFARAVVARGSEHIPTEGPLLIAANHPGTCDSLAIAAQVPRNGLKIVATSVPFIRSLPATANHLIYCAQQDVHERMAVVRAAIRHLREGGALLIFPSGQIDPDPAVLPGAVQRLESWSPSLAVMLRCVPQAQVLVTIVSGVLASEWLRSPITRLRRELGDRQRVAEFFQVMQQMLFPRELLVEPAISFAQPVTSAELGGGPDVMERLVERARALLETHSAHVLGRAE